MGGLLEALFVPPFLAIQPITLDQVAHRLQQGLELVRQAGLVVDAAIGQTHQPDLAFAREHGNADIGGDRRMALGQPAATRIGGQIVRDDHVAADHRRAHQVVESLEQHAALAYALIQGFGLRVPGQIGDGLDLEIRLTGRVLQHLTDEPEPAVGEREQIVEHHLIGAAFVHAGEKRVLRPLDRQVEFRLLHVAPARGRRPDDRAPAPPRPSRPGCAVHRDPLRRVLRGVSSITHSVPTLKPPGSCTATPA